MTKLLIALFLSICLLNAYSQKTAEYTLGLHFSPIIPYSLLINTQYHSPINSTINSKIALQNGYSLGIEIRKDIASRYTLLSGLSYRCRNYLVRFQTPSEGNLSIKLINYEIPLLGMIYIQTSSNSFLKGGFGINTSFYPTDVSSFNDTYKQYSLRDFWIRFSLMAHLEYEYKTETIGSFCLGATYYKMNGNLFHTEIDYIQSTYTNNWNIGVDGDCFEINLIYLLPHKEE